MTVPTTHDKFWKNQNRFWYVTDHTVQEDVIAFLERDLIGCDNCCIDNDDFEEIDITTLGEILETSSRTIIWNLDDNDTVLMTKKVS
tara:strand:- start:41 stop:301 length:261 start_codon:yes stop_codon:yes gene_type:complete